MAYHAPSGDELEKRSNFKPLAKDRYLVRVVSLKEEMQANPYDRTEDYPEGKPRPVLKVEADVIGFADGDADAVIVDVEDNVVENPKVFAFLDLTKIGMKPQPSKTRQFITAAQRIPIDSELIVDDWQELVGVEVIAEAGPNKNNRTSVTGWDQPRQRRRRTVSQDVQVEGPSIPAEPTVLPGEKVSGRKSAAAEPEASPEEEAMGLLGQATF